MKYIISLVYFYVSSYELNYNSWSILGSQKFLWHIYLRYYTGKQLSKLLHILLFFILFHLLYQLGFTRERNITQDIQIYKKIQDWPIMSVTKSDVGVYRGCLHAGGWSVQPKHWSLLQCPMQVCVRTPMSLQLNTEESMTEAWRDSGDAEQSVPEARRKMSKLTVKTGASEEPAIGPSSFAFYCM